MYLNTHKNYLYSTNTYLGFNDWNNINFKRLIV